MNRKHLARPPVARSPRLRACSLALSLLTLAACAQDAPRRDRPETDAGAPDATATDAQPTDATGTDARPADARPSDATASDAQPSDATASDAQPTDANSPDATPPDASPADAGGPFVPEARCFGPPDPGPCDGVGTAWAYRPERGACETFNNGGCLGEGNSFADEATCHAACVGGPLPEPAACQVSVTHLDDDGFVLDSATCDVEGPAGTCQQVGACICTLIAAPEDQESCLWAILGPRALQALGDYCRDGNTIAEVLAIPDWQGNGPAPIRLQASPGCAAVPAL